MDLLKKLKRLLHRTPVSERSKNPIEIIPMEEYYLKQIDVIPKMQELGSQIKFYPEMHKQILMNWLESINIDWPISRRRYYGTEIPIWYCKKCSEPHLPEPGKYYQTLERQTAPFSNSALNVVLQSLLAKKEHLIRGWILVFLHLFVTKYSKDQDFFKKTYPTTLRPQAKDIVRTWLYYTLLRCEQLTGTKTLV